MKSIASWILVLGVSSCGGVSTNVLGNGDAGGSDAPASCSAQSTSSISGTWDLLASYGDGRSDSGTLTIDANTFIMTVAERSLAFRSDGGNLTLTWTDGSRSVPIGASHTSAPVNVGLLPITAGGSWIFSSTTDSENCTATLATDSFTASCAQVHGTPFGTLNGTISAHRTQSVSSLFGDLGGTWHLTSSGGGVVDATFSGNVFNASITDVSGSGTMSLTVCDGVASGSTTGGVELSARRR